MRIKSPLSPYLRGLKACRQLFLAGLVVGCTGPKTFTETNLKGFVGAVNPDVRTIGSAVIQKGGNAADAMTAMLFDVGVHMPSRAGLGAGGICQVFDADKSQVRTLGFMPLKASGRVGVPALARGAFVLHSQYGDLRWSDVVAPAMQEARNGVKVSKELALDISEAGGMDPSWHQLKKGDVLKQPELGQALASISSKGSGVFYQGAWLSGVKGLTVSDLSEISAKWMDSIDVDTSKGKTYFPNPSVLSMEGYSIWSGLNAASGSKQIQTASNHLAKLADHSGVSIPHPKGVALYAADESGLSIVCTISMGMAFGSGQYVASSGFFLSEGIDPVREQASFANIIQVNPDVTDTYEILAGIGPQALSDALQVLQKQLLEETPTLPKDDTGLMALSCAKGYPNQESSCRATSAIEGVYTPK